MGCLRVINHRGAPVRIFCRREARSCHRPPQLESLHSQRRPRVTIQAINNSVARSPASRSNRLVITGCTGLMMSSKVVQPARRRHMLKGLRGAGTTMPKRRRGNTLEKWEVALIKAMLARKGSNDQDILAYFTRPTRSVNHRAIGEIRTENKHKSVKVATSDELDAFLV